MSNLFNLESQVALITGSSQGIGLGLAKGLAQFGAKIVLNGRDSEKLKLAAKELSKYTAEIDLLPFDVTDEKDINTAISRYTESGKIDILVNNAGIQYRKPLEEYPSEQFESLMKTNVQSMFYVSKAIVHGMIARKTGKIINIASVQAALARPGIAPYTATKGAVANLTKGMAADWAKFGIQCNSIAPGYFDTPLNEALVKDNDFSKWLIHRTPAGRWGKVEELVGVCVFLSSNASSFVNGQTIYVDGGITATI